MPKHTTGGRNVISEGRKYRDRERKRKNVNTARKVVRGMIVMFVGQRDWSRG